MRKIFYILLLVSYISCNNAEDKKDDPAAISAPETNSTYTPATNSHHNFNTEEENVEEKSTDFQDDAYSADVEYYNPETGTRNSYTLDVEVDNNTVTVIHFPKGGWIDETHITSGGELDEDGTTTIYTDEGHEFTITIKR